MGGKAPAKSLGAEVDRFCEEIMREAYRVGAGLEREGNEARIYRKWRRLFLPAADARLPPGPSRGRDRLQQFLALGRVDRGLAPCQDRRRNKLLRSTVKLGKSEVPFFTASVRLAELPEREERHALYEELSRVYRSLAREDEESWREYLRGIRGLGYPDARSACEDLFHYKVPAILSETERFLGSTDRPYRELLGERADAEGVPLRELRAYDGPRILRGISFSGRFPRSGVAAFLRRTVRDLGLPWGAFRLDLEDRPRKNPRAFCAPVQVPQEVYLVLRPVGGHDDYHTALHEMGHAFHFGLTDPSLDPIFGRIGEGSLTEGWAFVLDFLFLNPSFLRRFHVDREFVRFYAFTQLRMLRRYAGKIAYESRLFRDPWAKGLPDAYVRSQVRTTLFRPDEEGTMRERWRADVDPWMYTAAYLRAWMFAGSFTQLLEERWGEGWWAEPEAGALLARLWARGCHPTVEELLEEFGRGALSLRPLESLIRRSLDA
jgi:hypothetical protein